MYLTAHHTEHNIVTFALMKCYAPTFYCSRALLYTLCSFSILAFNSIIDSPEKKHNVNQDQERQLDTQKHLNKRLSQKIWINISRIATASHRRPSLPMMFTRTGTEDDMFVKSDATAWKSNTLLFSKTFWPTLMIPFLGSTTNYRDGKE